MPLSRLTALALATLVTSSPRTVERESVTHEGHLSRNQP